MTQTMTSVAALLASEFQDGQSFAISAQRVRDLIVSLNIPWVAAGGTGDAITATYTYPITATALVNGLLVGFTASAANTISNPTFNPSGLGTNTITKNGGQALLPGDIAGAAHECLLRFHAGTLNWELLNPANHIEVPWVVAAGAADAITATYSPAITTLIDGLLLTFRATAANATTAPTFAPNGLTAHAITKKGGVALVAGDIPGNLAEAMLRYNLANTRWELLNPASGSSGGSAAPLPGSIGGLGLKNNATTPNTAVDIASGACTSDDGSTLMTFASLITKTTGAWTLGSGNGALDTGTVGNNQWLHQYVIERTDTGVTDYLMPLAPPPHSANPLSGVTISIASPAVVTWANHGLQVGSPVVFTTTGALPTGITAGTVYFVIAAGFGVGAFEIAATQGGAAINTSGTQSGVHTGTSSPIMPASYTKKRCIWSIKTDGSAHIIPFTQIGGYCLWKASVLDQNGIASSLTAASFSITVPPGKNVLAKVLAALQPGAAGNRLFVYTPLMNDETPASSEATLQALTTGAMQITFDLMTDTSAQLRWVSDHAGDLDNIRTFGYFDFRGQT